MLSALMMKRTIRILLGLALAVSAGAETLSWDDCFGRTTENNIELSIGRLKLQEAEAQLKSQESVFYPDVSARASRSTGQRDSGSGWENTDSVSASLNGSYTLFSGFGNKARVTRSEAELQAEAANFDQTRSNIEYDLRKAFAEQLYAQELIALAETIAARRADNVRLVEMRYEGGREHKGSLLLSRAQHTQSLFELEQARRDLNLARRKLAKTMGQLTFSDFGVAGELSTAEPPADAALQQLAHLTPGYRSAEASLRAAEAGYKLTRSDRFPEISATGSMGSSGETSLETESWQAGISISLPLFTGGQLSQDIIASGLQREQSLLNQENTLFELLVDLQSALNTYRDAWENVKVQQDFTEAAEVRAEVARAQYQQGLLSFEEWDRIENDLISRQKTRLSSLRTAMISEAAWRNTLGLSSIK
jgi:outer membrane protein TolC